MLEFTGERVVPGLVDPNLFNEHLARYRFAARVARELKPRADVLDAGCGSGYGTAEFSGAASVVAMDISADAVAHARRAFPGSRVHFLQGACESLPFADRSFDLVLAFEVIEHLARWREMLAESRRVLRPSGVLLVSTPNKAWYNESRAGAGVNPYHVHEFDYREFETALEAVFPHVNLWSQNHSESIAFVPASPSAPSLLGQFDAPPDKAPEHAHFFLAACSQSPLAETSAFAWLPSSGNALRERQRHISLLESELKQKNVWLAEAQHSHAKLQKSHEDVIAELRESNAWAARADGDLDAARAVIAELQQEIKTTHAGYREVVSAYQTKVSGLEAEAALRLGWAHDLEAQIARGRAEIERLNRENRDQENTIAERTQWAQSLDEEVLRLRENLQRLRTELQTIEHAMLVRLGRKLQLVPAKHA